VTIIAVVGLKHEAKIVAGPNIQAIIGGSRTSDLGKAIKLAARGDTNGVISIGIAGALAPELKHCDVVLASEIVIDDERVSTDPLWLSSIHARLSSATVGAIAGSDVVVASTLWKKALHRDTAALAVDTESHIAAIAARDLALPFAVMRVISDTADRALPPATLCAVRPDGGVSLGAVMRSVLLNPLQIPSLIQTAHDANAAFATLLRCRNLLGPRLGFPNLG